MSTPEQIAVEQKKELPLKELSLKNPRKRWSDSIPVWIRVFWKKSVASSLSGNPQYHTIIPQTKNHTSWTLGAQPDSTTIKKVYDEEEEPQKKVHIVSMLAAGERVITEGDKIFAEGGPAIKIDIMPWFDHGALNLITGKNQTVQSMRAFQGRFYDDFKYDEVKKIPPKKKFYCHCMAGRSRSFLETMAFIYFYPDKEKLFDFENWPQKMREKIPADLPDLQKRLRDNPSFYEIGEFVKIQRPKVKTFETLDGDQAGLVGLMALSRAAEDKEFKEIKNKREINIGRLYRDARDIGLMLQAPLDRGFREDADLEAQVENLEVVYQAYKESGINLLKAMIVPVGLKQIVNPEETFEANFNNLSSSQQARFGILVKNLEGKGYDLQLPKNSLEYAEIAVKQTKKLTAGDEVELLRAFGSGGLSFTYEDVVKKILTGSGLDRHNAGIQLAELFHVIGSNDVFAQDKVYAPFIKAIKGNVLSYGEQFNFINRLDELNDKFGVEVFAEQILTNYKKRWFPVFNKNLSAEQIKILEKAVSASKNEQKNEGLQEKKPEGGVVPGTDFAAICSCLHKELPNITAPKSQLGSHRLQAYEQIKEANNIAGRDKKLDPEDSQARRGMTIS